MQLPACFLPADASPDHIERIEEFFARHGGPSREPAQSADIEPGVRGFCEVKAADGYTLRCDWSRSGMREDMRFCEIAPGDGSPS